jgi:hypothetical protein
MVGQMQKAVGQTVIYGVMRAESDCGQDGA